MGSAGLCGLCGTHLLRQGSKILRPGTTVEVGQAAATRGTHRRQDTQASRSRAKKKASLKQPMITQPSQPQWGDSYRLVASEKWKVKSAAMGRNVTQALVDYARPRPGMNVLDLASGTGEPAISLAARVGPKG